MRFQIHAETVPDFAVNISHLRAAGAGLEFVTSISETAVLTSSTTVKPRRAPAHTTSDWRVTVLAPGIVEGLHDPPMVRFGDWNGSDVQIVSINGGRDVVMQATAPSVPEAAVVALEVSLNSVDFTDSKLAFVFERFIQVEFLLFHAAAALIAVCCARWVQQRHSQRLVAPERGGSTAIIRGDGFVVVDFVQRRPVTVWTS